MAAPVLTAQQEAFCRAYLAGSTITAAAKGAGYSARSASVSGSRLLKRAKVRDYLAAAKAATRTEAAIDLEAARRLCSEIATDPQERSMVRLAAVSLLARLSNWDQVPPPEVTRLRTEVVLCCGPGPEAAEDHVQERVQEASGSDRDQDRPEPPPRLLEASPRVLEASGTDAARGTGRTVATVTPDDRRRRPRITCASRPARTMDY